MITYLRMSSAWHKGGWPGPGPTAASQATARLPAGGQGLLDVPGHAFGPDLAMAAGEHSCLVEEKGHHRRGQRPDRHLSRWVETPCGGRLPAGHRHVIGADEGHTLGSVSRGCPGRMIVMPGSVPALISASAP